MKKSLISLAVAAGLMAAGSANAAPTVYGFIDVSVNSISDNTNLGAPNGGSGGDEDDMGISSNTSAVGVKGSEDLGDGMKAIYKMEFQIDLMNRLNTITDRDQFVGLKGGMGTVKIGTMSSNYKQMGGKIDPFYRTAIQARNVGQQSRLHRGAGTSGGRLTNAIQYSSPKMGGMQMIFNTTMSGANNAGDETTGLGLRYSTKALSAWFDYLKTDSAANGTTAGESGMKVGAKFKVSKELSVGAQMEMIEDLVGADVMFLSATYAMNKNNTLAFSYGSTDDNTAGFSAGIWHKLSKKTSVYAAMNSQSDEAPGGGGTDGSIITAGVRKKF